MNRDDTPKRWREALGSPKVTGSRHLHFAAVWFLAHLHLLSACLMWLHVMSALGCCVEVSRATIFCNLPEDGTSPWVERGCFACFQSLELGPASQLLTVLEVPARGPLTARGHARSSMSKESLLPVAQPPRVASRRAMSGLRQDSAPLRSAPACSKIAAVNPNWSGKFSPEAALPHQT